MGSSPFVGVLLENNMISDTELLKQSSLKKRVFVCSPYTKPDPAININNSVKVFGKLLDDGKCIPINMLWTHFYHCIQPRSYEDWLAYCISFIPLCQAILRLPGESSGVDREVEIAKSLGIPVFDSIEDLYKFLDS